jgi:hypothetical protein
VKLVFHSFREKTEMRQRGVNRRRGFATVALRLVVIASYGMLTFGMPMPTRKVNPHDDPFPCQENACGCQTARQCWTSCQCFSPAERVRWAVRRGVPIPDYAILPPADELARILSDAPDVEPCSETGGSCCCSKKKVEAPPEKPAGVIRFAVGSLVAHCFGLSLDSAVPFDLSLPPPVVAPMSPTIIDVAPVVNDQRIPPRSDPPPSPPPRFPSF